VTKTSRGKDPIIETNEVGLMPAVQHKERNLPSAKKLAEAEPVTHYNADLLMGL